MSFPVVPVSMGAIFLWLFVDVWRNARRHRRRDNLRHITGAPAWWGKR